MGAFADYLASQASSPEAAPVDDSPGQFRQGLRSGLAGAYSQLQGVAGGVAEAAGLDNVAHSAFEGMRSTQAEAEANAPRVGSYKDVHDLRSGFDYVTGVLGQSVPQSVAAVAGGLAGRTPAGRALGATLANVPFETGDVVQRQQNDPASLQTPAGERLLHAAGGGLASSAAQSILPSIVAGKLQGAGAGGGVGATLRRGLREAPAAMGLEAGSEGLGEVAKQGAVMLSDPSRQLDSDAVVENMVGGAVGGGAMHGVGVAGETAHAAAKSPGNTLSGVVDKAKAALAPTAPAAGQPDAQGTVADAGKVDMPDPVQAIKGIYDKGAQSTRDFWDRIAAREDVADLREVAGQTAEQIKAKLPEIDSRRVEEVTKAAHDLLDKAGLDEARRGQLQQAMGDLTDRGNQAVVAGLKKGADATSEFAAKAKSLYDEFAPKVKEALGGAKKSEDFSGVRQAIAQELVPALQKVNPEIFTDGPALAQAADGVRMAIGAFKAGGAQELTSTQIARLIDTFGDETVNVLDAVHRAMGKVTPEENERFYGALNELRAQQKDSDKTLGLMMRSLLPELQDTVRTTDVRRELDALRTWVRRLDQGSQADRFKTETLKSELDTRYGKNADKILAAVEKESKAKDSVLAKEDIADLDERERSALGDSIFYGPEKGGLAMNPDLDPAGDKGQAKQAMARAAKQNPDRTVRFLSADELGHDHPDVQTKLKELQQGFLDAGKSAKEAVALAKEAVKSYGMAAAEGQSEPGTITKDNIKAVRVKDGEGAAKTSHYRQPSVFKVDNASYDAIALTKLIERQFKDEFNDADNKGALHRAGRMFMTGVAALQDHLGKTFPVADDVVIDHKGTTFGQVKGLDYTPGMKGEGGEHATSAQLNDQLRKLRNEYLTAKREGPADETAEAEDAHEAHLEGLLEKADAVKATLARVDRAERLQRLLEETGRYEADPKGPIHEQGDKPEVIRTNETGNSREKDQGFGGALPKDNDTAAKSGPVKGTSDVLREKLQAWVDKPPSAAAKVIAERGIALIDNKQLLNNSAKKDMAALLSPNMKASKVAETVNALWSRYGEKIGGAKTETETKPAAPTALTDHPLDKDYAAERWPDFQTNDEAKAFLLDAYKRWGELKAEDRRVLNDDDHPTNELPATQKKAFFVLSNFFESDSHADLGSFLPDFEVGSGGDGDTMIRKYLREAAPEVAAAGAPKGKPSLQGTGATRLNPQDMADVRAYVDRVLGPTVKTALANIPHAGEFVNDTIRISVHALNPKSVAYHEALHAFFDRLLKQGNGEVAQVLRRAAMAAPVQTQLRKLLAGEHAALAQLTDPEESAAYMYQFWATGKLKVGGATQTLFSRIRDAVAKVLGVWTQSQRAEAVMAYFHSGDFKTQGLGQPNAVAKALLATGRNEVIERARSLTKPLTDVADALTTAGGQRLRDTGVPALRELADLMKITGREAADDHGFIPAARTERTRIMNEFGAKLRGFTKEHIDDALQAMQSGGATATPEGRLVQRAVQGKDGLLPSMLQYMKQAGVDVANIQPRADYFPRLYDAHYISRHQATFQEVLERHGLSATEAKAITQNLMATNGAEFTVETDRPGMQHLKRRQLAMIPDSELAPFMRKNLFEILGSYVAQATRRAEWARRFGDDGQGIAKLLAQAKKQGATDAQVDTARKFVRAVDGTLGDTLSPGARRVMGNVIVYQNLRLLPLAIFSSVVDPLGIVVRGGTVSDAWQTFKRGMREIPSAFKDNFKADADTELAASLGVIDDAMLVDAVGQMYTQGLVGDTARKWNDMFFRFNLMEGFNRSMRVGATQAAIRFLQRHADGKASDHSTRWLAELGLQPGVKIDLADPKVRAAVNLWVDGAVLRPDAADKPLWMSDPHYMLISHLKQFVYAFQETILKRVMHEFQQGNYAPAMAITSYVPVMIAADLLKGLIQGGGELPEWKKGWGPGDYLGSGIERAGVMGKSQFAVDGVGMLLGPSAQQALSVAEALDGKGASKTFLKALPASPVYANWGGDEAAAAAR